MSQLSSETYVDETDPFDVVEAALVAADWVMERGEDDTLHAIAISRWGEVATMFVLREDQPALHMSMGLEIQGAKNRPSALFELVARLNERLWMGHFEYWAETGSVFFRHTLPLLDRDAPSLGEVAAMMAAGLEAVDRFLPAFNHVVWAGQSPAEATKAALFETVGEA
jgi:hypothetical protein